MTERRTTMRTRLGLVIISVVVILVTWAPLVFAKPD
jgi:hypothetical protein